MSLPADFWSEFAPVTQADWVEKITRDLKGKNIEDLRWSLPDAPEVVVDPVVSAENFQSPLQSTGARAGWAICEKIAVDDPEQARDTVMQALHFGAESLQIEAGRPVNPAFFEDLLQGVYLDMITWVFSGAGFEGAPAFSLSQWVEFARSKGFEPDRLRGQITWRPTEQERPDWRYTADLIDWARDHAPGFRILQVAAVTAEPTVSLSQMVADAHTCFAQLTKMSLPAHEVARQIGFSVRIGPDYFLEIARLRALQVLWYNLLKAWGAPPTQPAISVEYDPAAYTDEVYANMVRATTMAMSAVFGGADHITVLPYDEGREQLSGRSAAFARRIARNVQHLLKMESYLDTVADPAAGSYYIEQLTSKLAEAAWSRQ